MKQVLAASAVLVLLFLGCSPLTKDSFLSQYSGLIEQVRSNRSDPSFSWDKSEKVFEKFSQTYYRQFEDQMSWSEKVLCKKYEVEYLIMRTQDKANTLKEAFYDDLKAAQQRLDDYIENQMSDDIESIMKEVNDITSLAAKALGKALTSIGTDGSSASP